MGADGVPGPSRGILADLWTYLGRRPRIPTHVRIGIDLSREYILQRIVERIGIPVDGYRILNLHRIGIEAPAEEVFGLLRRWGPEAPFWPNALARVERTDGSLEHMRVHLFRNWRRRPLFELNSLRIQSTPEPEHDDARYLLYECRGGYPIGLFCLYMRSPLAARGEREPTQLFFVVAFNFYGRQDWPRLHPVQRTWEIIHNRVTSHVLNRVKRLCEARSEVIFVDPRAASAAHEATSRT